MAIFPHFNTPYDPKNSASTILSHLRGKYIYIFEFKYNESVESAMAQIHSRDYIGRYALEPRKVFLITVNFVEAKVKRGLEYEIHELI